jgi:hypothetical protein
MKASMDVILAEGNSKLDKMETSILDDMSREEQEMDQYISHLEEQIKTYERGT